MKKYILLNITFYRLRATESYKKKLQFCKLDALLEKM